MKQDVSIDEELISAALGAGVTHEQIALIIKELCKIVRKEGGDTTDEFTITIHTHFPLSIVR